MNRRQLGERLRTIRELRLLSQQDVARAFGCARETISNWERAERGIEAPDLARLAQLFDVDITYFYGVGEYHAEDVPPELQMVYGLQGKVVNHLPPGKARQRYIEGLRAQAETNWTLITERLNQDASQEENKAAETEEPATEEIKIEEIKTEEIETADEVKGKARTKRAEKKTEEMEEPKDDVDTYADRFATGPIKE